MSNRFLLILCAAFLSILCEACSDSEDSCQGICADPAYRCAPILDVSKASEKDYSDCEKDILSDVDSLQVCNELCQDGDVKDVGQIRLSNFDSNQWYCIVKNGNKEDSKCDLKHIGRTFDNMQSLLNACNTASLVKDGVIGYYRCEDGDSVSVAEGLRRKKTLEESQLN